MIALYLASGQQRRADDYMLELMAACAFREGSFLLGDAS